jgi:hypothetical protein
VPSIIAGVFIRRSELVIEDVVTEARNRNDVRVYNPRNVDSFSQLSKKGNRDTLKSPEGTKTC